MRFGTDFSETVTLDGGERLRMRVVRPADRERIIAGFTRLSPQTRYRRFLGSKRELSEQDLAFLSQCDGVRQYAIIVLTIDAAGEDRESIGMARFIRDSADAEVAELAIVVADEWQGRGIGRRLMVAIIDAAREWGVTRLQAYTLADNQQLRALLDRLPMDVELTSEDGLLRFTIPIPDTTKADALVVVDHLLRSAAAGTQAVLTTFGRIGLHHWLAVGDLASVQRLGRRRLRLPAGAGERRWMGTGAKLKRPPRQNPLKKRRHDPDPK